MKTKHLKKAKTYIWVLSIGLLLSGITAYPLQLELAFINSYAKHMPLALALWLKQVNLALEQTNTNYPFLPYGTDWLAFAHLAIALIYLAALKNLAQNSWLIQAGMLIAALLIPHALISGYYRGIPFFWQLIDCQFGLIAFLVLYLCQTELTKHHKLLKSYAP